MALELVNPDPRYGKVHLIEPAPLGYLHLAADLQALHRPGPVLRRSRDKHQLLGVLKWQAMQLAQLDAIERATVYDALAFTPPGGYVKDRPAPPPPAWFDVVVLVETTSPEATGEIRAAVPYQALVETLTEQARRVHTWPPITSPRCPFSTGWPDPARAAPALSGAERPTAADRLNLAIAV